MNRCEYKAQNWNKPDGPMEACGEPATVKVGYGWYCEKHGERVMTPAIMASEERKGGTTMSTNICCQI